MKLAPFLFLLTFSLCAQEVWLSLPASVDAALEDPDRAEELLAAVSRPADPLLERLEQDIRADLRERKADEALAALDDLELTAKVRLLYSRAAGDPASARLLLRLNNLPEELPVHFRDSVEDSLQPLLWYSAPNLRALAIRRRPDLRLEKNSTIRLAFQIQLDFANALFDRLPPDSPERIPQLIELAYLCGWFSEPEPLPPSPSPLAGTEEPVCELKDSPLIFNLFMHTFKLIDWSAY